ncbi:uncharacterized protein PG986_003232 [Apiospora aurea]|uniref:Uncharacterized protein n=1 Tax=Apiospora aurea TaxID=335848 RepID=A0ABR1QR26_9PEZI
MSKLMSWPRWCIDADKSLKRHETCSVKPGTQTHYQLKGLSELLSMEQSIISWREKVMRSAFSEERKQFCVKIDDCLRKAYARASSQPTGPISGLREPFWQLRRALKKLMIIRDLDESVPVKASEAPTASRGAEDAWLTIKLQYTKACLLLLIRIFWHVLPEYPEWWEEIEASLKNEDWLKQFILDTRKSDRRAVLGRERLPKYWKSFVVKKEPWTRRRLSKWAEIEYVDMSRLQCIYRW